MRGDWWGDDATAGTEVWRVSSCCTHPGAQEEGDSDGRHPSDPDSSERRGRAEQRWQDHGALVKRQLGMGTY